MVGKQRTYGSGVGFRIEDGTRGAVSFNSFSEDTVVKFVAYSWVREKPMDLEIDWAAII